jgi:uncharacterized membrane protein YoaK (UPF0700 family)
MDLESSSTAVEHSESPTSAPTQLTNATAVDQNHRNEPIETLMLFFGYHILLPEKFSHALILSLQFSYFDTYTIYFFQTFTTVITGNLIEFVVSLPTDVVLALYTLLTVVLVVVGCVCGAIIFLYFFNKKEKSLFVICLISIVIIISQLIYLKLGEHGYTGYKEYVLQTAAFVAGLKYSWSLRYSGCTTLAQTANTIKLFTLLIESKLAKDDVKSNTEMFVYFFIILFFIIGCFLSLLVSYFVSYNSIFVVLVFNVVELFLYSENTFNWKWSSLQPMPTVINITVINNINNNGSNNIININHKNSNSSSISNTEEKMVPAIDTDDTVSPIHSGKDTEAATQS